MTFPSLSAFRSERLRFVGLLFLYALFLGVALWVSYELRFDFNINEQYRSNLAKGLLFALPIQLFLLWRFGQFRGLLSFFRIPDLYRLFLALFIASGILFIMRMSGLKFLPLIPRGVILADLLFSVVLIVAFRTSLRIYREKYQTGSGVAVADRHRLAIIGAGSTGASLAADLLSRSQLGLRPVVFFDDDPEKIGRDIHGIPIVGGAEDLVTAAADFGATRVAIAIPSLQAKRIRTILDRAREVGLETVIVPGIHELSTGQVRVEEMREVSVEDLLGREPVSIQTESIAGIVQGKVVFVTGAGGSIGSELVRQILSFAPAKMILIDASEEAIFEINAEIAERNTSVEVVARVVNFRDAHPVRALLAEFRPSILFHAAAYKHVPLMEGQPWEAVANNSLGTYTLGQWAIEFGVERFVLISTDKAIKPTSIMGASKRLAEIAMQELSAGQSSTRFMAVRFGNVLGSSGSVIPTFRRQIARGGPVTVTHPEVTRYFMTIAEAVGLVLQSAAMGKGGDLFLLEMGEPVKIIDLARQMIELSGYKPETEIPITITGLRPGEKLFEELLYDSEFDEPTLHPRIRKIHKSPPVPDDFIKKLHQLEADLLQLSAQDLKTRIKELVPEYSKAHSTP